jgi:hypothetical protein
MAILVSAAQAAIISPTGATITTGTQYTAAGYNVSK